MFLVNCEIKFLQKFLSLKHVNLIISRTENGSVYLSTTVHLFIWYTLN